MALGYDPFSAGQLPVISRTLSMRDEARGVSYPAELWMPVVGEPVPLVVYSHPAGGHRRSATFLCGHLASHGYAIAALDHSEVTVSELSGSPAETPAALAARVERVLASRVPDVRLLLDRLLQLSSPLLPGLRLDRTRVGVVGHSLGGWTALATPEVDRRVRSVVAIAPGGSSRPQPGVLPAALSFAWSSEVATLVLAGEEDVMTPLDGVSEVYSRCPQPKQMFVLAGADHLHFVDDVAGEHESLRQSCLPGEAAWIPAAMRPLAELCPPDHAHTFVRALTLAHFDASLRSDPAAARLLGDGVVTALRDRGISARVHRSGVRR